MQDEFRVCFHHVTKAAGVLKGPGMYVKNKPKKKNILTIVIMAIKLFVMGETPIQKDVK